MTLPSFVLLSISWMVKCRVSLKFASDTGSSFPMNPLCIVDQEMGVLPTVTTAIFTAVNLAWFLDGLACVLEDGNSGLEKYEEQFPASTILSIQHTC